tara:strand:+ start:4608 stop:5981 length:1374 start_codon:yes stop_codon:yes gene_type:complete
VQKKIKLVIFDLDGVIVEAKNLHFKALNSALGKDYEISWEEHLKLYDGLKTAQKLEMLSKNKGLPTAEHEKIWKKKQQFTLDGLNNLSKNEELINLMQALKQDGFMLAVCSNSIRATVDIVLKKFGIYDFFELVISNEDVKNSKPHPEMYWTAMSTLQILPEETLIVEDSPYGLLAAYRSKANICRVDSPKDLKYSYLKSSVEESLVTNNQEKPKWRDKKMNILIPMAGAGSRFAKAGYTFPKPLIEVRNKAMIQVVVENLNVDANYIFVVQKSHREEYKLDSMLNLISPNCKIVEVDGLTEGAACTALLAKEFINNEQPLFFANSDQFVEWDSNEFFYKMNESGADGGIVTFKATHPKWSFAKLDENGLVCEVAEKNPISDNATVGFYYWKKGSDFVTFAEEMIEKDIRTNNEFYVCPVFNQAIEAGKVIKSYEVKGMWGLGTPEDLDYFIKNYNS